MAGIGERLSLLRAARGVSARELAARCGIPYSDLLRLENGGRRHPPPETLVRLADFFCTTEEYLLLAKEPSPEALRTGFFRHWSSLETGRRRALKYAPIQGRVEEVLQFLEMSFPTVLERRQVAPRLGYTSQALEDVLRGRAPLQSHLLKLLSSLVGFGIDFFVRGDFFGGAVPNDQGIDPELLNQYYQVVQEAIGAGVSPEALRQAVRILTIRPDDG